MDKLQAERLVAEIEAKHRFQTDVLIERVINCLRWGNTALLEQELMKRTGRKDLVSDGFDVIGRSNPAGNITGSNCGL